MFIYIWHLWEPITLASLNVYIHMNLWVPISLASLNVYILMKSVGTYFIGQLECLYTYEICGYLFHWAAWMFTYLWNLWVPISLASLNVYIHMTSVGTYFIGQLDAVLGILHHPIMARYHVHLRLAGDTLTLYLVTHGFDGATTGSDKFYSYLCLWNTVINTLCLHTTYENPNSLA